MRATDILVLGLLSEKSRHGYEINREISTRGYRNWVKVSDVAIYKALARLQRGGWLVSLIEREGNSPDRCVYSLSENGRGRLSDLVFELLSSSEPLRNEYFLSFEFLSVLDRNELSLALERRADAVRRHLAGRQSRLELLTGLEKDMVIAVCRHEVEIYQRELSWLEEMQVLAREH